MWAILQCANRPLNPLTLSDLFQERKNARTQDHVGSAKALEVYCDITVKRKPLLCDSQQAGEINFGEWFCWSLPRL